MKKILFAAIMLLAPLTMSAQKFGHFNTTEIVPLMPEYQTAQTELQNLAKQYEDDLKRMQDELQKKGAYAAERAGQPAGLPESTSREDAGHLRESPRCRQADWRSWWLRLYHGRLHGHPLHQHQAQHRHHARTEEGTRHLNPLTVNP